MHEWFARINHPAVIAAVDHIHPDLVENVRVNIYSQELTKEVALVTVTAKDTGIVHHGVRFYLASPDVLHHRTDDDDRSAVTFWVPRTGSFTAVDLATLLGKSRQLLIDLHASGAISGISANERVRRDLNDSRPQS